MNCDVTGLSRRHFFRTVNAAALGRAAYASTPRLPKPSPGQLAWQDMEVGMFIHFDMQTFSPLPEQRWQEMGHLDPNLYNPTKLDTDQWMEAAKSIGAKYAVFVAKHRTGFLQWQSDLIPYGVKQSKWRGGKGDVVRDFVNSCRKYGIKPGIYAGVHKNAWWTVDRHRVNFGRGGDPEKQAAYATFCEGMLTELWSRYGELVEIWFDGGPLSPELGGAPIWDIQQKLQPLAMIFAGGIGSHATIRWVGNEKGTAGYPCWATVNPQSDNPKMRSSGDPDGPMWMPGEADAVLRGKGAHSWFWEPGQDDSVSDLDTLKGIYYNSVGRNANLLLNAAPDRDGLIPAIDLKRYSEFGREIRRRFGSPLARTRGEGESIELTLPKAQDIDHVVLMEEIADGERIREYVIERLAPGGAWERLCDGISVGHKRIQAFSPVEAKKIRLRVMKAAATPKIRTLAVYRAG